MTENVDDNVLITETTDTTDDPVVQYSLLGDDVSDGLFAWISVGVDITNVETVSAAAVYSEDGGSETSSSSTGGGAPPNGTAPTRK